MSDIAVQILLNATKEVAKLKVSELLEKVKQNNDETTYAEALQMGDAFFKLLAKLAAKSKTKVDDIAIKIFHEPVKEAMEAEETTEE